MRERKKKIPLTIRSSLNPIQDLISPNKIDGKLRKGIKRTGARFGKNRAAANLLIISMRRSLS